MAKDGEKFWVVWNPDHGVPRVRHDAIGIAMQEARRLARENPGHRFIVLEAVWEVAVQVPMSRYLTQPEMPF